jgi:broad specificity phosphatase PhoE
MEFGKRIDAALDALIHRLDDGSRAVVVAHGGVIHSVLSGLLGFRSVGRPWPVDRVRNAALTTVAADHRGRRLITFNDARHTRADPHPDETGPVVTLVRHGESEANLTGAWHGRTDGSLSARGRAQGAELAGWLDGITHVYSSPLRRAAETARAYASVKGLDVAVLADLVEIDFGTWEDHTPTEARAADPDLWRRIYDAGEDLPRGHTGERSSDAADRIERAVARVVAIHGDGGVALFGHGGALRAYLGRVVGLGHADRRLLALPGNAAASRVRVREGGASLAAFNIGAV